jgi:hypothetical protein
MMIHGLMQFEVLQGVSTVGVFEFVNRGTYFDLGDRFLLWFLNL